MFPHDQFKLTRQAALLAAISAAFPISGYAAVAGRIDFSIGEVSATAPDGKVRPLARGAEVAVGDTIVTGATGRAQVRFTDGAYSSIQPQTQFRVDDYEYAGKTDGGEKGFFSLLKGGLRTITGAIGRVNKQTYRVTTPTATIGIRGTEYLAREGNSLTVSVGEGIIEVCNAAGCLTVADGHSAFVRDPNTLPTFTLYKPKESPPPPTSPGGGGVPQENPPPKPTGDGQTECDPATQTCDATSGVEETPSIVTLPPPPTTTAVLSGRAAAISAGLGSPAVSFTDCVGTVCGSPDLTVTFGGTDVTRIEVTSDPTLFDGLIAGTVQGQSVDDVLFLGRWVNGTVHAFGISDTDLTAGPGQGYHYVVGVPTSPMPATGVGTYSLAAATVPTFSDGLGGGLGTGAVTAGTLTADFGAGTLGASMDLSFSGSSGSSNYQMTSSGTPISGAGFTGFGETAFQGGAVNVCSVGCITLYNGFFAGTDASHAGLAYEVFTDGGFDINGAAAFTQTSLVAPPAPDQFISGSGAFSLGGNLPDFGNSLTSNLDFDTGTATINSLGQATAFVNAFSEFNLGTASVTDFGFEQTATATIAWGRWTNGTFTADGGEGPFNVSVSSDQGFHYFGGVATTSSQMVSLASLGQKATYTLISGGATSATSNDGSLGLGTFSGGSLVADFGAGKVGLAFNVTFPSVTYSVATTGGTSDPALSELDIVTSPNAHFHNGSFGVPTSASGAACSSGCTTFVEGLFAGINAARAGFTYEIEDFLNFGQWVHGAAAFQQSSLGAALVSGSGFMMAVSPDGGEGVVSSVTATFDSSSRLTAYSGTTAIAFPTQGSLGTTTIPTADSGADSVIGWGRWTNGTTATSLGFDPVHPLTVSANQSFHYVVGVPTPGADLIALASSFSTATYSLMGATSATSSDGSLGLGTFSGSLEAFFFSEFVSVNMGLSFPNASGGAQSYSLSGSASGLFSSGNPNFAGSVFGSASNSSAAGFCSGCSGSINGFFAGANAVRAGLSYTVFTGIPTINGTAAFKQTGVCPGCDNF